MSILTNRVVAHLEDRNINYAVVHHHRDYTAQQAAADTHTPGHAFAKVVVVHMGNEFAMAIIPAHRRLDLMRMREQTGCEVALARETEFAPLFPDCEPGAEPPFGHLYGMDVYVDPELGLDDYITFNAGTHSDAIRMRYEDFTAITRPHVLPMTR